MVNKEERTENALLVLLALLGVGLILYFFFLVGPQWDVTAHYLSGRALLSPEFYSASFSHIMDQNAGIYFEQFRSPFSEFLFAGVYLVLQNQDLTYIIYELLLFALFFLAVRFFARKTGRSRAERLVLYAVLLTPYFILFPLVINSTEIISASMLIFALAYMSENDGRAGLFLGLASLSKYISLAFLPLVFLLRPKKQMAIGLLLEAAAILPWLAFNQALFGNPLLSYEYAFGDVISSAMPTSIPLVPFLFAVGAPAIFAILAFAARGGETSVVQRARRALASLTQERRVLLAFLIIAAFAFAYVARYHEFTDQARWGYALAVAVSIPAAAYFFTARRRIEAWTRRHARPLGRLNVQTLALILSIAIMLLGYLYVFVGYQLNPNFLRYNVLYQSSVFAQAKAEVQALGYSNCLIVSNAWISLLYENMTVYSPYSAQNDSYPILMFRITGVDPSLIKGLGSANVLYSNQDFEVLATRNATCIAPAS